MREHWEILGTELHAFKEQLEELLEMLPQSQKFYKKTTALNKAYKKVQRAANDMDQFITPVKSVKVTSPFLEDPEFAATWKMWKEYLIEQHGIHMRSRAELAGLKRMVAISEKDPKTAVHYLEFYMSRMDKGYYKVNETDIPQSSKTDEKTTGIKIQLPAQYQNPVRSGVSPPPADRKVKQKTLQEEIEDFKNSKKKKS